MATASTFDALKPQIENHVLYLRTCAKRRKLFNRKKPNSKQTEQVLERLHEFVIFEQGTYNFGDKFVHKLAKYMVQECMGRKFLKIWKRLIGCVDQSNWESQEYRNLRLMLRICWNLSDASREFSDDLVACGFVPYLLEAIKDENAVDEERQDFNNAILSILQNCVRRSPLNRDAFRNANAIPILQPCLESKNELIQLIALMTIAYIVHEEEREILAKSESGITVLIMLYKRAVEDENHRAPIGFSALETLDAINHLAINDADKAVVEEQGAIPSIIRMLEDDFSDEERRVAAETLWNLSFIDSIRESDLLQGTIPTLTKLAKSSNKDLRGASTSALWEIQGGTIVPASPPPSTVVDSTTDTPPSPPSYQETMRNTQVVSQHTKIMLSYQWDAQQMVLKIKHRLERAGFHVWMDVSNIKGDILSAMAKGVEESDVILMCISELYRDSKSCRSEATYAYKLDKKTIPLLMEPGYKPDGWLGVLQGMDLYYEFYSDEKLNRNMPTLRKVLSGGTAATEHGEDTVDGLIIPEKEVITGSRRPPDTVDLNPATAWSEEEVQEWLGKKKFHCPTLEGFDGAALHELYIDLQNDAKAFREELKSGFEMDCATAVRFTSKLRKLFK